MSEAAIREYSYFGPGAAENVSDDSECVGHVAEAIGGW